MTSSRCFSNVVKEDIRHKYWMIVLSVLGNVLAMPVFFSLVVANRYLNWENGSYCAHQISSFMGSEVVFTAGFVAGFGALIVGLSGFAYLFKASSVDLFESLPIKRSTNFFAKWLNGFLIWFVPFLVNFMLTGVMAWSKYSKCKDIYMSSGAVGTPGIAKVEWLTGGEFALRALKCAVVIIIFFALIYHLCLLASMLCGNAMNAFIVLGVLGFGVLVLYAEWVALVEFFLHTYAGLTRFRDVSYASPMASAVVLLYEQFAIRYFEIGDGSSVFSMVINAAEAILFLVGAFFAYEKRPSEFAGHGMKNKVVRLITQTIVTVIAGLGGFMILYALANDVSDAAEGVKTAWGIFGGVLCGVFAFGVLNVIFNMEFKSFMERKLQMAITVAAALFIGLAYAGDWFGYDTYLPKKSDIKEIGIYDINMILDAYDIPANLKDSEHPINRMHFDDTDAAYALLENFVAKEKDDDHMGYHMDVRVTLKNGKTYYRRYCLDEDMYEQERAVVLSQSYIDTYWHLPENIVEAENRLQVGSMGASVNITGDVSSILNAYNQDLAENPEGVLFGGRAVAYLQLMRTTNTYGSRRIILYEGMTHTVKAIEDAGYGEYVKFPTADQVSAIRLNIYGDFDENLNEIVRGEYGVVLPKLRMTEAELTSYCLAMDVVPNRIGSREFGLEICGDKLQEELLAIASCEAPDRLYAGESWIDVELENGRMFSMCIPKGSLPEDIAILFHAAKYMPYDGEDEFYENDYYKYYDDGIYYVE